MRKSLRKVAATLSALTLALAVTATAVPTDVSAATISRSFISVWFSAYFFIFLMTVMYKFTCTFVSVM